MNNKSVKIITYCGNDDAFWHSVCDRYKSTYPQAEFEFETLGEKDPEKIQYIVAELLSGPVPSILYIDFSINFDEYFALCILIKRTNTLKNMPVIALIDRKEKIELAQNSLADVIHIKCGEQHDVVYHPYKLAFPKEVGRADFAIAKFTKDVMLFDRLRIGYINDEFLHVEGNNYFEEGETVEVDIALPREINSSSNFISSETLNHNLYFDYQYGHNFEMTFVDPPKICTEKEEELGMIDDPDIKGRLLKEVRLEKKAILTQFKEHVTRSKKKFKSWLQDNSENSKLKKTKIYIIDDKLKCLSGLTSSLGKLPFVVRLETVASENFEKISRFRPDIIAIRFINPDKFLLTPELSVAEGEELEKQKSDATKEAMGLLSDMVKNVMAIENYSPFIIVFNCKNYSSSSLQDSFQYPLIMTNTGEIHFKAILDMATLLEAKKEKSRVTLIDKKIASLRKKDPKKYGRLTPSDFEELRFYPSKRNKLSYINLQYPIELRSVSETELSFATEKELALGIYHLDFPVPLSIAIIAGDDGSKYEQVGDIKIYQALIHATDENDKKEIRKFVNEIFFSTLNEQRDREKTAFNELNKKNLAEKSGEILEENSQNEKE